MHEVLNSVAPWVAVFAYVGFGYAAYSWVTNRSGERQLISRNSVIGILAIGFVAVLVLLYLSFSNLQSRTGILSVF